MDMRLPEKIAKIHVIAVCIFYLVSGIWEYLVGLTQAEDISSGSYFLLDAYRNYATCLGKITILFGIFMFLGMLFKLNIFRWLALSLAWWNLFTSPLIGLWWNVYSILVKKIEIVTLSFGSIFYSIVLIIVLVSVRLYIIYILRVSKAGYIFLKKGK